MASGDASDLATVPAVRRLLPEPGTADPVTEYLAVDRPAPADRPWVVVGMITTLDGASATDGTSGGLGGPADSELLRAVRGIADAVVVGAGTVRAEDYGPLRHSDEVRSARSAAGRSTDPPRLVIVSGSLGVTPDLRVFDGAPVPPLVCTSERADQAAIDALAPVAEVLVAGEESVDVHAVLRRLRDDGVDVVVCEGGPTLNAAMVDAGVVDEWCVTVAPLIAGGDSQRIVSGAAPGDGEYGLESLLTADGLLFGRWVRR